MFLGLETCQKLNMVNINSDNFQIAAITEADDLVKAFPDVFDGKIGTLPGTQTLSLHPSAKPQVMANRRVPISLRPKLKDLLENLVTKGVIAPVDEPTPWVSQIVLTKKKSGEIRMCLDPHELNKAIQREHYTLPILEDVLHELRESKFYTKADLSSGYWHVLLDEPSSLLTTFQTCFGRYRYLRLPFGVNCASECFQKKLLSALSGLPGCVCIADDVIIHGKTANEHDCNLKLFLARCSSAGIKLNRDKLDVKASSITFMGHKITTDGIQPDPEKVTAITEMKQPTDLSSLRRFLGMVNYLQKFLPNLTTALHPLHQLLKQDVSWNWSSAQEDAFNEVKRLITTAPALAYYNPDKPLVLENDACEYGLGSALLQEGKPVAFASRSLSETETRYAQIEKEMLAVTYGLEKFHQYTYGRKVSVITDHKPLIAITSKPLSKAPRRLQNLLMRAQKYDYHLIWKPGKQLALSDTLSRAPIDNPESEEIINCVTISHIKQHLLDRVCGATATDDILLKLMKTIVEGWPDKRYLDPGLLPYFNYRDELTAQDGIVYRADRVVIPSSMRQEMKQKVHEGHLGINSCLRMARDVMYWPGMSSEIRQYIETCGTCAAYGDRQPDESPIVTDIPKCPWVKTATDIFSYGGNHYCVYTDYHSNFFEIDRLFDLSSQTVIKKLGAHFARYGAPVELISDNGPQFSSSIFRDCMKEWNIRHITSSPHYPQANGAAEAAVKTVKRLMRKCQASGTNFFKALLNLRNVPTDGLNTSPAQRSQGRRTNSLLPTSVAKLKPGYVDPAQETDLKVARRLSATKFTTRNLRPLRIGDNVRMQPTNNKEKVWREATVMDSLPARSYIVKDSNGKEYRRNRQHLRARPKSTHSQIPMMNMPSRTSVESSTANEPVQNSHDMVCPGQQVNLDSQHQGVTVLPQEKQSATLTTDSQSQNGQSQNGQSPYVTRVGRVVRPPQRYGHE